MNWFITSLKKYADFTGRSRRKEYWFFVLFQILFGILAIILDVVLGTTIGFLPYGYIYILYIVGLFIPSLSVTVRRLHDIGRSGWWFLLAFVPLVGQIIILVFMFLDSEPGANKWGPNPKTESGAIDAEALDSNLA